MNSADLKESLGPGAVLLRGFATPVEAAVLAGIQDVIAQAPFRHMITPGGHRMSAALTNCGALGWVTDRAGYRYDAIDPESGKPWLRMAALFLQPRTLRPTPASAASCPTPASSTGTSRARD